MPSATIPDASGRTLSGQTAEAFLQVFFAHPCHSWERGTNENTNGLVWNTG
jgi:IS30 family transposase